MLRTLLVCGLAFGSAFSQKPRTLSVPADSPRWDLEQEAKVVDYQGRKSIRLDRGAAVLKEFEMRDGVIDVDVATPVELMLALSELGGSWGFICRLSEAEQ